ncbi:glycosyltransferase family 2 protein [Marivita sp. GX14005]|uniref:glycosyltransferase family 2 protein n=1 Tax=Marivita sp. GX14005 TaxID=2942276 RepID=UPI0020195635|nr:glycosyltransferase family 2 protein [Marivita sp. GX14005]MCL3881723.1 glycosyltransferase [Marivita sp. GX14005]
MSAAIDICICTFRRPGLADTLASLREIDIPGGTAVRLLIVDNDDTPSAKSLAKGFALPFPVTYIHAPARNISIARNAGLDAAQGDFLAFLDDDETVSRQWLARLYSAAYSTGADVVFGPARAIYPDQADHWLVDGDYHSTKAPAMRAALKTGCSANVLIRLASPAVRGLRFDTALGRSGGEDTVLFRQVHSRGGVLRFAEDALVFERVEFDRLSLRWLLRRKLRAGQSHARAEVLTSSKPMRTRIALLAGASAKAIYCGGMSALHAFDRSQRNLWLIRGALHLGAAGKCIGLREPVLYGHT